MILTIQHLKAALADSRPSPAAQRAAADYARSCREAEARLEQVASMLSKGSDYQALQIAEQEPALLDLVAALSFGSEKAWQEFCEKHELPVAPLLDAKTVQAVEGLYSKGLTANHPLYKDLRSAVLSRDDVKALRIVRTILKLNPGDANARAELLRLENKRFQETLEALKTALKSDDEELISSLTETLVEGVAQEKLLRLEAFQQGDAIRCSYRRRQALDQVPELLSEMKGHQEAGDWQAAGQALQQVDRLIESHQIDSEKESWSATLRSIRLYVEREQVADSRRRAFEQCLKRFELFATEIETRLMTGSGVSFAEIAEKDEAFVRMWKELEGFQMAVPAAQLQRLQAAGQELRAKLERMQRGKRIRTLSAAAAVMLLLVLTAAAGVHAWKAFALTGELASYQQTGKCLPAEELIGELRKEGTLLTEWPYLQAKMQEVDAWCRQSRMVEGQAGEALGALENSFLAEKTRLPPAALVRQLGDAEALLGQLPSDLEPEPRNRLAAVQTQADLYLSDELKRQTTTVRDAVIELEKVIGQTLSFEIPASITAKNAMEIHEQLQKVEVSLKPEIEQLRLPSDLETRIYALRQKVGSFQAALETLEKVREGTRAATSLQTYQQALVAWQDLPFAETAPALSLLDKLPTETGFLAAILTGGDEFMLKAILEDVSGPQMLPAAPMDRDLKMLLALREDESLNNVWEHVLTQHSSRGKETVLWSAGPLSRSDLGLAASWRGRCYEPTSSLLSVSFVDQEFRKSFINGTMLGQSISGSRISATSDFMNSLQLNRMTDPDGERFMRSMLDVMDVLVKNQKGNPLAKAFVLLNLEEMAKPRAYAWGLHLSRSLQADLRNLRAITADTPLRSDDWLLPDANKRWTKLLTEFFEGCRERHYLKEAIARRSLLSEAAKAGLHFGGYVEVDKQLILTNAGRSALELWVMAREGSEPLRVKVPSSAPDSPGGIKVEEALSLSPVFFIPVDREKLLARFDASRAATGREIEPLPGEAPFITP